MHRRHRPLATGPAAAVALLVATPFAPAVAAPITFAYTGAPQTFTALTDGLYDIAAYGAQGGRVTDPAGEAGGLGAEVSGHFVLVQGETLSIAVGGQGSVAPAGGGGGGGSFVVLTGSSGNIPLLIAGGGGGAGEYGAGSGQGGPGQAGTAGAGGGAGGNGGKGGAGGGNVLAGPGDIAGGGGGGGFASAGSNGDAGSARGGDGGSAYPVLAGGANGGSGGFGGGGAGGPDGGGGGGGGFSGGGGGGYSAALTVSSNADYTAGGGGGSYNANLASADAAIVNSAGVRNGDGLVTIDLAPSPTLAVSEPTSLALLGIGTAGLIGLVRCRRKTAWLSQLRAGFFFDLEL